MKSLKSIFAILLFSTFIACDDVDELTEIDTTFTMTESFDVAVQAGDDELQSFTETATFNLAEDDDVADNLSSIEEVTINSLTYRFSNVVGIGARITSAQLSVGSTTISLAAVTPSDAGSQVFTVADTAALNTIATALRNNPQATVTYSGEVADAPLAFTLTASMNVTVVVDVL
ncbi:hypothetical protein EAX61_09845 [Dokdonia sinensis]|uniref:Uncharacterized protein n=1 Tax=Dokdonia sinensis TaxID=2479847 RepID=A0A3M0G0V1_9FLAO|nr:hypothetical protein [Dokdonia sinensis]RMB58590.1 hypothetical protein EAX61_09845 [Dokdonia sinensis]